MPSAGQQSASVHDLVRALARQAARAEWSRITAINPGSKDIH